jgi:hypothetical protein
MGEKHSIIFSVDGNWHEPNTLCKLHVMRIYLLINFCLVPSLKNVLENNTRIGMVMTVLPMFLLIGF